MGRAEPKLPALQEVGGSFCRSLSSLRIRFDAICLLAYSSLLSLPCARAKQSNEAPIPVHTTPTKTPPTKPQSDREAGRRKREGIGAYKYGRGGGRREEVACRRRRDWWRKAEEAAGGFWNLLVARGLVWIGRQGREGGEADGSQSACRYPQHPPSVRHPALFVSLVGSSELCFADSFNRSHDGPRSIVVVVLDASGWAADFRPVLRPCLVVQKF